MIVTSARFLLMFVFLCFQQVVFSRTAMKQPETLLAILDTTQNTSIKIHTEIKLANYYIYHNLDSAEYYINLVLNNPKTAEVLAEDFYLHLLIKAWTYQGNNNFIDAKEYMEQANEIVSKHENRKAAIEIRLNLASILVDLQEKTAIEFIDEYLLFLDTTAQNQDDRSSWILAKQLKAQTLNDRGNYKAALEELVNLKQVSFLDDFPNNKFGILNEISIALSKIGDLELSEEYLREAIAQPTILDFERKFLLFGLVELFITSNEIDSSQTYLNKTELLQPFSKWESYEFYYLKAKIDLNNKNYSSASSNIKLAQNFSKEIQDDEIKLKTRLLEAAILCKTKEWGNMKTILKECKQILDQKPVLNTLDRERTFEALSLMMELRKHDKNLLTDFEKVIQLNRKKTQLISDKKLKEVMVAYELLENKQKAKLLEEEVKLGQQKSKNKNLWLGGLSIITVLSVIIGLFWRKLLKVSEVNNALLAQDKVSLENDKGTLILEKEELIFEKEELKALNEELEIQITQDKAQPEKKSLSKVTIVGINKTHLVDPKLIKYVTADREGSLFHLTGDKKTIWSATKFKDSNLALQQTRHFIQVGRSTIINKTHVDNIASNSLTTNDGVKHKIGRPYKSQIIDWIDKK